MAQEITDQESLSLWVREQFQRANKHLAERGILFSTVVTEESRYLAPDVAVWKIKDTKGQFYWVISGDLPADALPESVAKTAREAFKHFSMTWQMKAENIKRNAQNDETQVAFADLLIKKAEYLYKVQAEDKLWQDIG